MELFCVSHQGSAVLYDVETGTIISDATFDGGAKYILQCDNNNEPFVFKGKKRLYIDDIDVSVLQVDEGVKVVNLVRDARFASSTTSSGPICFDREEAREWETFLFIDAKSYARLKDIRATRFLSLDKKSIITFDDKMRDGCIYVGSAAYPLLRNITNISNFSERLILEDAGFRVSVFERYEPLVYYTCFGSDARFELFAESVLSLVRAGQYVGDVLLVTDRPDAHKFLPENFNIRLILFLTSASSMDDFYFSRYDVFQYHDINKYTSVLYVDTDVLFFNDVNIVLKKICISKKICVGSEEYNDLIVSPVSILSIANAQGADLFRGDNFDCAYRYGFNSGIIGFRPTPDIKVAFDLVQHTRRKIYELGLHELDQPVANYIFHKMEIVDYDTISGYIAVGSESVISCHKRAAEMFVIVHFWRIPSDRRIAFAKKCNEFLEQKVVLEASFPLTVFSHIQ